MGLEINYSQNGPLVSKGYCHVISCIKCFSIIIIYVLYVQFMCVNLCICACFNKLLPLRSIVDNLAK